MNRLTRMLNDTFIPKLAIVVYESSSHEQGLYLERRDIKNGKMGCGTPLTKKCISDIMDAITIDKDGIDYGIHGAIPSNLLYADTTPGKVKLVWYNPPEKRKAYFAKATGIEDGEMWVPGLLYVASESKLSVFAFKGQKPKSKLYRAPFMNVGEDSVCLGNSRGTKPTDRTFENLILYWEDMFWRSEFSHLLGGNPVNGNLAILTKHLMKTGEKFPNDVLIPCHHTLKSLLR